MPVYHCKVCGAPVANYSHPLDELFDHYCSIHHPDLEHRIVDEPPTRMTVRLAPRDDA